MDSDSESIKKIRNIAPLLKGITAQELKSLKFDINDQEIEYLVRKFEYER